MPAQILTSPLLQTAICLVFIYALLSLLASSLAEVINSYFNDRGKLLYNTISKLFDDNINVNFGQLLYNHPMIANLRKDTSSLPQYISDTMFSQVLVEVIGNYARKYKHDDEEKKIIPDAHKTATGPFERFQQGVSEMQHTSLKLMLLQMAEKSAAVSEKESDRLTNLEKQIQQWYNDQMERTGGWFKKSMSKKLFYIGILVALTLNIDTINVFRILYNSPELRGQVSIAAEKVADSYARQKKDTTLTAMQQATRAVLLSKLKKDTTDTFFLRQAILQVRVIDSLSNMHDSLRDAAVAKATDELADLSGTGLPVGWHRGVTPLNAFKRAADGRTSILGGLGSILMYILGILLTAFAISNGAPFWFDLLLKFVNIRKAGGKPAENN